MDEVLGVHRSDLIEAEATHEDIVSGMDEATAETAERSVLRCIELNNLRN